MSKLESKGFSYLELVKACNNFPDIDISQTPYTDELETAFYAFLLPGDARPHGFIHPDVVAKMPWTSSFRLTPPHARPRQVELIDSSDGTDVSAVCNVALAELIQAAQRAKIFNLLGHPHDEDFRIMGSRYRVQMQRSASALFGIANRGAHLTAYVRADDGTVVGIWVPRRAKHVRTYPGMLDSTCAGGVRAEETPFECILHEADEEASLSAELIRDRARAAGVLTYVRKSEGEGAGREQGLMNPDLVFVYDLELREGEEIVPRPKDDEVHDFRLVGLEEVQRALRAGEYKPNCALVMIDFLIRHGLVTAEDEEDYVAIVAGMHRSLPVPTSGGAQW